ncbi:MAG: glycosyltransferase [Dehalococcoidia bacterium]
MKILCVVPVYGQPVLTQMCLKSIAKYEPDLPVLVWDDGSPDETMVGRTLSGMVKKMPQLEVVTAEHRGIHGAWNGAVEYALGKYPDLGWIFLLGSDTELTQYKVLEGIANSLPHVGAIHAALYNYDSNGILRVQWSGSRDGQTIETHGLVLSGAVGYDECLESKPQPWVTHSAVLLNVKALKAVKAQRGFYYDDGYRIYCGDRDISYAMRELGYEVWSAANMAVMHYGGQSVATAHGNDRYVWERIDTARLYERWEKVIYSD